MPDEHILPFVLLSWPEGSKFSGYIEFFKAFRRHYIKVRGGRLERTGWDMSQVEHQQDLWDGSTMILVQS